MFLNPHKGKLVSAFALSASAAALALASQLAVAQGTENATERSPGLPLATLNAQVFETVAQDTVTIVLAVQVSEANQDAAGAS